ncbi:MAG: hypothetical protein C0510_01575 [Erythrobacter sp.]|nr:hypothetical protein [Erythrobacter sp.]
MMRNHRLALIFMVLGACDREEETPGGDEALAVKTGAPVSAITEAPDRTEAQWSLQRNGAGTELVLQDPTSARLMSFACASNERRLEINVPAFTTVGSEERLSFGSGGEVEALVADVHGDRQRGGVSAEGAVPSNLATLIGGSVSASYGAQFSGPHPAVPLTAAKAFVATCSKGAVEQPAKAGPTGQTVSPCLLQDGQPLKVQPLRAIGTEPFWGARIEGRCVTYSHPEDQEGTRVWTRYTATPHGGVWSGALGGHHFELRTRAAPGCSDGTSDKTYVVAVDLLVHGEKRKGCAEPS